jgi:archaemetzincin
VVHIYIVPIETAADAWIKPLAQAVRDAYGLPVKCVAGRVELARAYDRSRQQYNSSQLLLQLINDPPADAAKILGVAEVDLFIPVLTFVFGEAQLDGIGAIVSVRRLQNAFYGLPDNRPLMVQRLVKEAIHELGHTFGLVHCRRPGCVLNASTYAEDIDQKEAALCFRCREYVSIRQGHPGGTGIQ